MLVLRPHQRRWCKCWCQQHPLPDAALIHRMLQRQRWIVTAAWYQSVVSDLLSMCMLRLLRCFCVAAAGLSDTFVLMDDDLFLTAPWTLADFVGPDGGQVLTGVF